MSVVSVGDLTTPTARARRAEWMQRFDVGAPPEPIGRPLVTATAVGVGTDLTDFLPPPALDLLGPAAARGWYVELYYSKGPRLGANGKDLGIGECVSVRAYCFPAQRCVITYERSASQKDWSAGDGWLWMVGAGPRKVGVAAAKAALTGQTAAERSYGEAPYDFQQRRLCPSCAKSILLTKAGQFRIHGPKDNRCRPPMAPTREG
jgi:hypothetical protein